MQKGYWPHFTSAEEIEAQGGSVPCARAMHYEAAKDPAWIEREDAAEEPAFTTEQLSPS